MPTPGPRIAVIGDNISRVGATTAATLWPSLLAGAFAATRAPALYNWAVDSKTSQWFAVDNLGERIIDPLGKVKPGLVIIALGMQDVIANVAGDGTFTAEQLQFNVERIIDEAQFANSAARVIVANCAPKFEDAAYTAAVGDFNAATAAAAAAKGVQTVDFYTAYDAAGTVDNLNPNDDGHAALYDAVWAVVQAQGWDTAGYTRQARPWAVPERDLTHRFCSQAGTGGALACVYLGGSITAGYLASNRDTLSWRALTGAWLDAQYPAATLTHYNAGVSSTPSWYGLIRLQTDVIARAPALVVLDFGVNDLSSNDAYILAAEALIRRLRTALPDCTLVKLMMLDVTDHTVDDATHILPAVREWWTELCRHYRIPIVDYLAEVQERVWEDGESLATYFGDHIHPNDTGHALAHELLRAELAPRATSDLTRQWPGDLADYDYLDADSADYENTPVTVNGADGVTTGTWTVDGTAIESSEADATIAFTGTCQSFAFEHGGTGTGQYKVDAGAYAGIDFTTYASRHPLVAGTRGAHTVTLKVVSGTVHIDRFLAV